jgi:hypothetical protein
MRFPNDGFLIIDDRYTPTWVHRQKSRIIKRQTSSLRFHRAHTLSGEETNHRRATNARKDDEADAVVGLQKAGAGFSLTRLG